MQQLQELTQLQELQQVTTTPQIQDFKIPPTTIKIPPLPNLIFGKPKKSTQQGFDVLVRKNKNWQKVNKKPMDKSSADNFGFDVVDNSSAASYKLRETDKPAKKSYFSFNSYFGKSKLREKQEGDDLVKIEKRQYRIDTPGEIEGISAKGWAAKRLKKTKNSLLGGLI